MYVRPVGTIFSFRVLKGCCSLELQILETYHLRPKSASFNYLLSREQESLLSALKLLNIAPTSGPCVLLGHSSAG